MVILKNILFKKFSMKNDENMSGNDLRCKFCSKPYSTKSNKLKHERNMHSAEKKKKIEQMFKRSKTRKYPCSVCGIFFTTNSNMNRHKRDHSTVPKRVFPCVFCRKGYTTRGNLKLHVNKDHANANPVLSVGDQSDGSYFLS